MTYKRQAFRDHGLPDSSLRLIRFFIMFVLQNDAWVLIYSRLFA